MQIRGCNMQPRAYKRRIETNKERLKHDKHNKRYINNNFNNYAKNSRHNYFYTLNRER